MKNIFYLLGIQSYANHDSGASILKYDSKKNITDYVAISEERLIRKKYPYTFPVHSMNYCMEYFNLKKLSEINLIFLLLQNVIKDLNFFLFSSRFFNIS